MKLNININFSDKFELTSFNLSKLEAKEKARSVHKLSHTTIRFFFLNFRRSEA